MSCLANCLANTAGAPELQQLCYSTCANEPPPAPVTNHNDYPPTPPATTNSQPITPAQLQTYTRSDGWIFCIRADGNKPLGFAVNPYLKGIICFSSGINAKKFFGDWKSPYLDGSLPPYIFLPNNVPTEAISAAYNNKNKIIKQTAGGSFVVIGYPPELAFLSPPDYTEPPPAPPLPPPPPAPPVTPAAFFNIFNPIKYQTISKQKNNLLIYAGITLFVILAIRRK